MGTVEQALVDTGVVTALRLVQRVPQDKVVVERFTGYWMREPSSWTASCISRSLIRRFGWSILKGGQLDIAERLAPTDAPRVTADPKLRLVTATALA
jgi:peptide/nickel transport system substrate-binding protein